MKIVFIKEYLSYPKGLVFEKIDEYNGQRLIGLGVAKKVTGKKQLKKQLNIEIK